MKICPNCNFENISNSLFCQECGAKLPDKKASKPSTNSSKNSLYQKLSDKDIDDVIFTPKKKKSHLFRNLVIAVLVFFFFIFVLVILDSYSSTSNNSSSNNKSENQANKYFTAAELSYLQFSNDQMFGNDYSNPNPRFEASLHNSGTSAANNIIAKFNFYKSKNDSAPQDTQYVILSDYLGPGDSTFLNFYIETPYNTSGDFLWDATIYSAEKY